MFYARLSEVTVVRKSLQNLIENKKIIKVEVVKDKFIKNATEEEFKKFLAGKKYYQYWQYW
ncbi:DNA-formamidopyrimidine glycosylase family protein [Mycoplasma sp. 2248]|uniref:DNA-formamidopyrimidine glycosylase family protein n=1 Tax=Mycoplasma sp. 2248 TaxID=3108528 RepID=UPI002B1E7B0E|nr:DNA-formamidopyrimidine glycosylase family protein [Mycoplasma sp. 2248]